MVFEGAILLTNKHYYAKYQLPPTTCLLPPSKLSDSVGLQSTRDENVQYLA